MITRKDVRRLDRLRCCRPEVDSAKNTTRGSRCEEETERKRERERERERRMSRFSR